LRAWHNESFCTLDRVVKALHARRGIIRNNIAPELRPKADDEVHSSRGGAWFTDSRDGRGELLALLRVQNVKLKVGMRGGSKSEDSSLRRVHAGIISSAILANELSAIASPPQHLAELRTRTKPVYSLNRIALNPQYPSEPQAIQYFGDAILATIAAK
jgi:hypothetical protein